MKVQTMIHNWYPNLSSTQVNIIKKHLGLVFKHEIDPSMGDDKHQEELNKIHHSTDVSNVKMRC